MSVTTVCFTPDTSRNSTQTAKARAHRTHYERQVTANPVWAGFSPRCGTCFSRRRWKSASSGWKTGAPTHCHRTFCVCGLDTVSPFIYLACINTSGLFAVCLGVRCIVLVYSCSGKTTFCNYLAMGPNDIKVQRTIRRSHLPRTHLAFSSVRAGSHMPGKGEKRRLGMVFITCHPRRNPRPWA